MPGSAGSTSDGGGRRRVRRRRAAVGAVGRGARGRGPRGCGRERAKLRHARGGEPLLVLAPLRAVPRGNRRREAPHPHALGRATGGGRLVRDLGSLCVGEKFPPSRELTRGWRGFLRRRWPAQHWSLEMRRFEIHPQRLRHWPLGPCFSRGDRWLRLPRCGGFPRVRLHCIRAVGFNPVKQFLTSLGFRQFALPELGAWLPSSLLGKTPRCTSAAGHIQRLSRPIASAGVALCASRPRARGHARGTSSRPEGGGGRIRAPQPRFAPRYHSFCDHHNT